MDAAYAIPIPRRRLRLTSRKGDGFIFWVEIGTKNKPVPFLKWNF